MKTKDERHYSGPNSEEFWKRIGKLPQSEQDILYRMGCALQTLESQMLEALMDVEYMMKGQNNEI